MKMHVPAIPIINIDPYFSVWAEDYQLKNIVHWTGSPNTMSGDAFVDGFEYHFFGIKEEMKQCAADMRVEEIEIDAFSTLITYVNDIIRLKLIFTSPLLVEDLYLSSRPVAYCKVSYESIDGKEHDVSIRFTVGEDFVLNKKHEGVALAHKVDIKDVSAIKMGNGIQNILWRSGDDVRIDWGYFFLGVKGEGIVDHTVLNDMYAVKVEAHVKDEALFLFAYDDIDSIQYFGKNLKAYWKKNGKTIENAIAEAAYDYDDVIEKCNFFSNKVKEQAILKGDEKYAELLLLSIRQIMAGHKLVVDENGENLYISKECFSNGCAATVDVTYPSAPMFLLYNTELLKAMLRPIFRYVKQSEWHFDFAPHDIGQYPLVNGQVYGVTLNDKSDAKIDISSQMPVEECGNMLILMAAICESENDWGFAKMHIDIIERWSKYLIKFGLDPENQLCTDDFAGSLPHNVNLSIKAIMGIAGYARILHNLGNNEAKKMMDIAREYAASLIERAANSDGSTRLTYDRPESFSLKYNAVWDKIWNTELFPKEFYKSEIARYKKELLPYGVPLDSREKYTKSDWFVWAASLADKREDFCDFVDTLWSAYNVMRTNVPMTDWYYCDTSHMRGFRHRTVQGGLFIRLLLD